MKGSSNLKPVINKTPENSDKLKRKANLDRIRTSLQSVPLLQNNLALNRKRLSKTSRKNTDKQDSDSANESPEEGSDNLTPV